jgi:hypothetical protein
VFPDLPQQVGSCAADGVLGSVVGMIGSLQAHLTLAVILGSDPPPHGRLIRADLRSWHFSSFSFLGAPEPPVQLGFISTAQVDSADLVIDLRSVQEIAMAPLAAAFRVEPAEVDCLASTDRSRRIVLCCRSGVRAWRAAHRLQALGCERLAMLAMDA